MPYKYKNRDSYNHNKNHIHDKFINLGYDYRGKLYKNNTSPELWGNPNQTSMILEIEKLYLYLINSVKYIKKTFSIAHDKDSNNIN